jgi:hypothetical protein
MCGCQASSEMWSENAQMDFSVNDVQRVRLAIYCVSGSCGFAAASSRAERATGQHYVRDPGSSPPANPIRRAFRMGSELTFGRC